MQTGALLVWWWAKQFVEASGCGESLPVPASADVLEEGTGGVEPAAPALWALPCLPSVRPRVPTIVLAGSRDRRTATCQGCGVQ